MSLGRVIMQHLPAHGIALQNLNMTAQVPENLIAGDEVLYLTSEPLAPYLAARGIKKLGGPVIATCCWRGYVGTWKIEQGRLYLVGLQPFGTQTSVLGGADTPEPPPNLDGMYGFATFDITVEGEAEPTIGSLFPEAGGPVFAEWFTGRLLCPQGKQLEYVHMGYMSTYERTRIFWVESGVVTGDRVRDNTALDPGEAAGSESGAVDEHKSSIPPWLIAEYELTRYSAETNAGQITLQIGLPCPELGKFFDKYGPQSGAPNLERSAAFLTAWNTYGENCAAGENAAANAGLEQTLIDSKLPYFYGAGQGRDSGWPAEASFLVLGISEQVAINVGKAFEQNAIVVVGADLVPRLVMLR